MYNLDLDDPLFLPHRSCSVKLEVAQGEAVLLTGENGIGKSTLFKHWHTGFCEGSFLEQGPLDFFYDRTLSEVYQFFIGLKLINSLRWERLWSQLKLKAKEDRLLSQLSGGEAQALKLCLALAKESPIYFLDEPSQFLDLERKVVLKQYVLNLLHEGRTFVIIEHNLDWPAIEWRRVALIDMNGTLKVRQ